MVPKDLTVDAPPVEAFGARLVPGQGVQFSVWAPHARSASAIGDFNDWQRGATPMTPSSAGVWTATVPDARAGSLYRYELLTDDGWISRVDPRAHEVTHSMGNGIVHDPAFDWEGDTPVQHPRHTMVIYEMHVGTVARRADQAPPATFDDAIGVLDHLARLGISDVQLMPVAEFAGDLSWGYNPACPFAVEQAYGGPAGLKRFVKEAHRRNLGVILDVVYNHFGRDDLHLWRFDGWSDHDGGGIYFYNDHRAETPWGRTRPDYRRGEVRSFIRDNALMWLEDYHVDGLRFDMTLYMRTVNGEGSEELADGWSLMQWVNTEVQRVRPGALTIAEDLQNHSWLTGPVADGGAGFGAQWDARFVHPVRRTVVACLDEHRSMHDVAAAVALPGGGDAFTRVVYSESHDEVANGKARVPHEIAADDPENWFAQKRSTLAATLVFTAPGIPMLFQGQEFLQGGWFRDDSGLDWHQADQYRGIVRLYRDLIAARRNLRGSTSGLVGHGHRVFHLDDANNVVAFQRWSRDDEQDAVVVVVNLSHCTHDRYAMGFPAPGRWRVVLNTDATCYSPGFAGRGPVEVLATDEARHPLPATVCLQIPAYTALLFVRD